MARYNDLMELKNDTTRKNAIHERVAKTIYSALIAEFGNDFVRYIDKEIGITENMSKVTKNTVVTDVGDVIDIDGYPIGVCVEISVKVKRWNTVVTKSGNTLYAVSLDDYQVDEDKGK